MRVFVCQYAAAAQFITDGWINALNACGFDARRWDGQINSWNAFNPDIYFGDPYYKQNFPKNTKTKIVIHANPFGERLIPDPGNNDCNETQEVIKWVVEQKPHLLWGYGNEHDIKRFWNKWTLKHGIPVIGMPTGGDAVIHYPVSKQPQYMFDISFIGGRWGYKAKNLDKYLLPVLNSARSAVWGWGGWDKMPFYKGKADNNNLNAIFSSAKVCPTIVEPHTTKYSVDMPERIFKLGLCGAAIVSDPVFGLEHYYSNKAIKMATNPTQFKDYCMHFINNETDRIAHGKQVRLETLKNHTYFSRLQPLLRALGFNKEADIMQNKVNEISCI